MGEPTIRHPDSADLLEEVHEVVRLSEQFTGTALPTPTLPGTEFRAADNGLSAVRRSLHNRLEQSEPGSESSTQISALLLRAGQLQLTVKDNLLQRQLCELECAQEAVNRLRSAVSTATLAERIPVEAYRMGFTRVLFSHIRQNTWLACSAFTGDDHDMARRMVEVGSAHPRALSGSLLESDMVRQGQPILVRNAQSDARVHPELGKVTQTAVYVAAPVYSWGRPIGLVHADRHSDGDVVGEFDREALGMFAQGLGIAFERNLMIERLRAMRHAATEHLRVANALADDFTLEVMDLAGPAVAGAADLLALALSPDPEPAHCGPKPLDGLTVREYEVLRAIAAGKTNAQIATALFVTEGTVKSHVKHILRKLNAQNRTEAMAKYHQDHPTRVGQSAHG